MLKSLATSTALLLLAAWAVAATGVPEGVVKIQTEIGASKPDLKMVQVNISIRNDSPKTITALSWTPDGRYADGSARSNSATVDLINDLLTPGQEFRPGSTRTFQAVFPLVADGDKPISVDSHLTMLVFEDNTVIGDARSIGQFTSLRKSMAEMEADEVAKIDAASKDPDPKKVIRAALAERQARGQQGPGILGQILAHLEGGASQETILQGRTLAQAQYKVLADHSTLTTVTEVK